jgi:hypothetical protein
VLQLVEVLGVGDGFVVGRDRHDAPSDKLLHLFVFRGGSPTEDGGDGLGGTLVDRACILLPSSTLVVICFIVVTPWPLCIFCAKSHVQPLALPQGVLGTVVDRE